MTPPLHLFSTIDCTIPKPKAQLKRKDQRKLAAFVGLLNTYYLFVKQFLSLLQSRWNTGRLLTTSLS